jgi:hypothetical protein
MASTAQVAEGIRGHCEVMAREIGRRVYEGGGNGHEAARHAEQVLLDWFLGDFLPGDAKLPGDSNSPDKGG